MQGTKKLVWALALAGCACTPKDAPKSDEAPREEPSADKAEPEPEPVPEIPERDRRTVPDPLPKGDLLVSHECSHSMQPFGNGYWSRSTTFDLAKGVLHYYSYDTDGEPVAPDEKPNETVTKSDFELTDTQAEAMRKAVDRVLSGGPYQAVYPVSEGISCSVVFSIRDAEPFLTIERSEGHGEERPHDQVDLLISAFGTVPAQ